MAKGEFLGLTAAEREELMPLILRAARAAARQSRAEAACERTDASTTQAQMARVGGKANDAQRETCAAGEALYDAHRALVKKRPASSAPKAKPGPKAAKRTSRIRRKLGYKASDLKPAKAVT